jgi:hypothetical protein
MKRIVILSALFASLTLARAQEALPREEALKYAFHAAIDLKQMQQTPIPTDPDVKRPIVLRDGDYGAMILPESKLNQAQLEKAGKTPVPVAQLWLHKLAPLVESQVVSESRLKMMEVRTSEGELKVTVVTLGFAKNDDGAMELVGFGKGKEPVFRTPVKTISGNPDNWIDMLVDRRDDSGVITLKILGKYEASFAVTDPDLY